MWVEARTGPDTLLRHAGETYRLDAAKRVSRFTELHQWHKLQSAFLGYSSQRSLR